jgi:hypothetical protein
MIRIKTKLGDITVSTILSLDRWYTVVSAKGQKSHSLAAKNLRDAGANHLSACVKERDRT